MRAKSPCKNCSDRHYACHDSCTKYKDFKEELEKERALIQKDKLVRDYINDRYRR